jgi:phosphoglucosamine mutase
MGLKLARTAVGDRYVVEHMREHGFNVGGEQSGHLVLSDFATTGDGLIAALQVLSVIAESGHKASDAAHLFEPLPQILKNVRYRAGVKPLESQEVATAIQNGEARLAKSGRLLIRKSGTESLIRVMAEGDDEKLVKTVVGDIVKVLEKACAA